MPNAKQFIDITPKNIDQVFPEFFTPQDILKVLTESVPVIVLDHILSAYGPSEGMRTEPSIVYGTLESLVSYSAISSEKGEVIQECDQSQVECLYIAVTSILAFYPELRDRASNLMMLYNLLQSRLEYFGFPVDKEILSKVGHEV